MTFPYLFHQLIYYSNTMVTEEEKKFLYKLVEAHDHKKKHRNV